MRGPQLEQTVRFFTRKIYRKFPELDAFSDEQCERLVRAANRRGARFVRWLLVMLGMGLLTLFVGFPLGLLAAVWIAMLYSQAPGGKPLPDWIPLALSAGTLGTIFGVILLSGLSIRNSLLRASIDRVLRSRRICAACDYELVGLPARPDGVLVCPECGFELPRAPNEGTAA